MCAVEANRFVRHFRPFCEAEAGLNKFRAEDRRPQREMFVMGTVVRSATGAAVASYPDRDSGHAIRLIWWQDMRYIVIYQLGACSQ